MISTLKNVRVEAAIAPPYPRSGCVGRQPIGVPTLMRMYCLQQWYGLADEALEDALYDTQAIRDFVGIESPRGSSVPAVPTLRLGRGHVARQIEAERRADAGLAGHLDAAAMAADDAVHRRQSEAGALADRLGGEEGVEDPGMPKEAIARGGVDQVLPLRDMADAILAFDARR